MRIDRTLAVVGTVALALVVGTAPAAAGEWTTVAHYTLDSAPVMYDSSPNHLDGTATAVQVVPGRSGNAYYFDGKTSYGLVEHDPALDPGDRDVRVSLWIKTTYVPAKPDWDLYKKGYAAKSPSLVKVEYQPDGRFSAGFQASEGHKNFYGGPPVNDGRWHQVTVTKTDDQVSLTVDGVVVKTSNVEIGSIENDDNVVIGAYRGPTKSGHFKGAIDNITVQFGN